MGHIDTDGNNGRLADPSQLDTKISLGSDRDRVCHYLRNRKECNCFRNANNRVSMLEVCPGLDFNNAQPDRFSPDQIADLTCFLCSPIGHAASGEAVNAWTDLTGNVDLAQGTGASQPLGSAPGYGISYDGNDDVLTSTTALSVVIDPMDYYYAIKFKPTDVTRDYDFLLTDSAGHFGCYIHLSNIYAYDSVGSSTAIAITSGAWHVFECRQSGATRSVSLNGSTDIDQTSTGPAVQTNPLELGGRSGAYQFLGSISKLVIYDRALSVGERARVRQWMQLA